MGLKVLSPQSFGNNDYGQFGGGALRRCGSQPIMQLCRQLSSPPTRSATCSPSAFKARCLDGAQKPVAKLANVAQGSFGAKSQESAFARDVRADIKVVEEIRTSVIDSLKTLGNEKYAKEIKNIKNINLTAMLPGSTLRATTVDICFKIAECCGLLHIQPWMTNISDLSNKEREMISDKNILLALVTIDPEFICIAPDELIKDKKFILEAVGRNGMVLMKLPEWQDNRDVVMTAVMQNGLAIAHASDRLKKDKILGIAAVIQCNDAIDCLPDTLQRDTDILKFANRNAGLLRDKSPKWSPFIRA